jgi:hypothetical protein
MSKPLATLATSTFTDSRRPKDARKYRSHCKFCGTAVYADEKAVWLVKPMGLSHAECAS